MERIKRLTRFQKIMLLIMGVMLLLFTILYPVTIGRNGFSYRDTILIPTQNGDNTIYSGKIQGQFASFTVYSDKTVEFQYGDCIYGPYIACEDSSAVPKDSDLADHMTGLELRCGDEVLFRGGVLEIDDYRFLYNEDGSLANMMTIIAHISDGTTIDENGDPADLISPSASTILELMAGPELTHNGTWYGYFSGVILCLATTLSMLYADELFRWNLSFHIQDASRAEPSGWEIAGRYISWVLLPTGALVLFILGMQ